jgi:hypothetical protein
MAIAISPLSSYRNPGNYIKLVRFELNLPPELSVSLVAGMFPETPASSVPVGLNSG